MQNCYYSEEYKILGGFPRGVIHVVLWSGFSNPNSNHERDASANTSMKRMNSTNLLPVMVYIRVFCAI